MKRKKNGLTTFYKDQMLHILLPEEGILRLRLSGWQQKEYRQKRYLLWKLPNLLEFINGSKVITIETISFIQRSF